MDYINLLLRPNGFWPNIIYAIDTNVMNLIISVILVTLIIKTVMLPIDVFNKIFSKISTAKKQKVQPQVDKIKKTYANNPAIANQKINELYKKEGMGMGGNCLMMLIPLILTSLVFITFLGAITNVGQYNQTVQYIEIRDAYYQEASKELIQNHLDIINEKGFDANSLTQENINTLISERPQVLQDIKSDVTAVYLQNRDSFIWVKNVWKNDAATSAVGSYNDFIKIANKEYLTEVGIYNENNTETDLKEIITETEYNNIFGAIEKSEYEINGYYILPILAALITFASMQMPTLIEKIRAKIRKTEYTAPPANMMIMGVVMSVVLFMFVVFNNAAFGLYVVTGALFGLITTPFITMLTSAVEKRLKEKEDKKVTVSYSRKNLK